MPNVLGLLFGNVTELRQLNNGYVITKLQSSNLDVLPRTFLPVHSVPTASEDLFLQCRTLVHMRFPQGF
jgi:hypothetical protein